MKALELFKNWTPEIEKKVEEVLGNQPEKDTDFRNSWTPMKARREVALSCHKNN